MNPHEHPVWPHLSDAWQESIRRGHGSFDDVWMGFPELRKLFPKPNEPVEFDFPTLESIKSLELPPREPLIGPISTSAVTILAASRGTGKTMFATELAQAVASGEKFCNWQPARQGKVILVQLDMGVHAVQKRAANRSWHENFHYVTRWHFQRAGMAVPDIGDKAHHDWLVEKLRDYAMVVFDTRRAAQPPGAGSEGNLWHPTYWLRSAPLRYRLTDAGCAVVLLDHLTDSGEVKDTKAIEDDADCVIALKDTDKGTHDLAFQLELTKDRDHLASEDAEYFEFDGTHWRTFSETSLKREVFEYRSTGNTIAETAEHFSIGERTVKRWCRQVRAEIRATHGNGPGPRI